MKNFLTAVCSMFLLSIGTNTYATHVMGADITYTCDSAYAYTFKLVYYRYCGGVPLSDPSSNTQFVSVQTGTKVGVVLNLESIKEVTPLCKSANARCYPTNTSRTGEGIEAHTYTISVNFKNAPYSNLLSNGTCEIRFETGQCCRNSNITTGAANQNFYTYATLNLCEAQVNNSPQFLYPPIGYLCCNQPSYSSVGGFDLTDFDSLSYSFANPLKGYNNNISYSGNYTYEQPFNAYYPGTLKYPYNNPNANPPIGIYLDEANGSVVWTPMKCDEITVAVLEIIEWRKDSSGTYKKIGLTRRDMQYVTKQCPDNNPPILKGNKSQTIKLNPCMEEYCFTIESFDKVSMPPPPMPTPPADTVSFEPPTLPYGVSFNILNPLDTNPSAEICIDLRKVDLDKLTQHPLVFPITIRDNACPLNAVSTYVYRLQFDTTNATGKVRGFTLNDVNRNCTQNTGEDSLRHIRKVGFSKQGYYQYTESNGSFTFCVDTGTTVASLMPSPWYEDQCASDTIQIQKDSIHEIVFYSKLKDGIAGYVYTGDTSCKVDSNSTPIRGQMVMAQPGNHYTITDKNGFYLFDVSPGKYTISLVNDTTIWTSRCTKTVAVTLAANETKQIDTIINYHNEVTDLDVKIGFNSGKTVRKGTDSYANIVVTNKGKSVIDTAIISVQTDNNLVTLSKSHYSWKSLGSGLYQTTVYNLLPQTNHRFSLYLATNSGYNAGDSIPFLVTSDSLSTIKDFDHTNNHDTALLRVVAPYDPNIKTAYPDSIFTVYNRRLTYTVEFQNEGTAPAHDVVVRDTLSDLFDLSSLQVHYGSHDFNYILEGNQLWFEFDDIYLPTKKSDEPGSIGSVTFSIALKSDIFIDTLVSNRVGIYFDTEDVVLTDYHVNHFKSPIEFTKGIQPVYCDKDTIELPFIAWFKPNTDNQFILEMTDTTGAFQTFTPIDSIQSNATQLTFKHAVSDLATSSAGYRYRIRSTSLATDMFTSAYSQPITVEFLDMKTIESSDLIACHGTMLTIKPSEYHFGNTCYLNGKAVLSGTSPVYNTDSMSHGDFVYFEHKSKLGCTTSSDTVFYTILSIPNLDLPMDSVYCDSNETVQLKSHIKHSKGFGTANNLHWDFGDKSSASGDTTISSTSHNYSKGKFDIVLKATNGHCSDSASITLYVGAKPTPNVNVIADNICPKEVVNIVVNKNTQFDFNADSSYWNFGEGSTYTTTEASTPNHRYTDSGRYKIQYVLFSGGCESDTLTADINVVEAPKGMISSNKMSGCLPFAKFTFNSSITGSYKSFEWLVDGNVYDNDSVLHTFTTKGKKQVTLIVKSNGICVDTSTVSVDVFEKPEASFEIKTTEGFGIEVTNTSLRSNRNYWTIDTNSSENNDVSFRHVFNQNGGYMVRLISESIEGCLDTFEDVATVSHSFVFYVPNTFSPNNDAINETFNVVPNNLIESIELTLYDRFGVMVLESKDKNNLIDKELVPGVYLMSIDIIDLDGTKHAHNGVLHVW